MLTAVITAAPGKILNSQKLDQLCQDWQGSNIIWLAEYEAVMFRFSRQPEDYESRWLEWQAEHVDLNLIDGIPTPKSILVADMDSTMIKQECLDELAEIAGVGQEVRQVTARAMNGELDFDDALRERVALLKGQPTSIIDSVLNHHIQFMPGAVTLLATMRRNGGYAALVSGGFTPFTQYVSNYLGFDEHHGNVLMISGDTLTGAVANPIKGKETKEQICLDLSDRFQIPMSDIMAVGDGANDLAMLDIAGMGVAFHAKPVVAAASRWRINHGDLTTLLYLQGYRKSDFITHPSCD
ncbi:MAG: phosphoserine phosphatase SerB [Pseudomonadota bacterium]|nr:phosphoserine phosphatase SerB [Pseudomonadota bacterium]